MKNQRFIPLNLDDYDIKPYYRDSIVSNIYKNAENICNDVIEYNSKDYNNLDRKLDRILTSRIAGLPIMLLLLGIIFWITITGANYPSQLLSAALFWVEERLTNLFVSINAPMWLHGMLVLGCYRTLAWVVSVMLPPMAIFFPIFTLLEDLGYLPRVAFNLDRYFNKACAHGKQALTMCMGFGCNAAGVISCRIIESPREKLIAMITNNLVPCNGRFPTLITLSSIFMGGSLAFGLKTGIASMVVVSMVLLGIAITLLLSWLLSKTILKGIPSSFTLELPPYRKPQVLKVIVRSIFDRTLFVLGRAVVVAAPAGIVIWLFSNIHINNSSILNICANFLHPFAHLIGMDGYIIMAFILGLPANEIVIPILIMSYMSTGAMLELDSLYALKQLLMDNGWTWLTALNVMLFSLLHWPCATTLWTIKKESDSNKWTITTFILTTLIAIIVCFIVTQLSRLFGIA